MYGIRPGLANWQLAPMFQNTPLNLVDKMNTLNLTTQEKLFLDRMAMYMMTMPMSEESMKIAAEKVIADDLRIFNTVRASAEIKSELCQTIYNDVRAPQ